MSKTLTKNSGAYGHVCCVHSIQPDFSMKLVSWPHSTLKNFKSVSHSSKHFAQAVEIGLLSKGRHWKSRQGIAGRVQASLLGVGAPEALVIAVVALVVFGPKGLAEVARTLGKSLKAFQPTIQELQQVSKEFKNTLEQEIGLDELRNPRAVDKPPTYQQQPPVQPPPPVRNGAPEARAYSTEDYVRVTEEQAKALVPEELRREAEAAAWGGIPPKKRSPAENDTPADVNDQKSSEDDT